jgi:3',5'-cyclic-AMP phosphodiesterase
MAVSRKDFLKLSIKGILAFGTGNSLASFSANSFTLPSRDKIKIRFALASDGHFGQPGTDFAVHHDDMVRWLNQEKKQRGIDFTVINGDLFHDNPTHLSATRKVWDRLSMPYYVSHGNHDLIDEGTWVHTWNCAWNHSFELHDSSLLILNTAGEKGEYTCPNLSWVKERLDRYQSSEQLFVFMHITPLKWTKGGIECPELVDLFNKQANLKLIFHGHDHDQDNVKENQGKYYFFDSHVAGNWGTDYRGYRIVEILKTGDILTYQMNPAGQIKVNEHAL